jgi:hypothetical protein
MRRGLTIKAIRNLLLEPFGTLNDLDYTIRGTSKHSIVDVCFMAGQYGPGCHSGVGIDLEAKELTRFRDDRSSEVVGAQSNCASHLLPKVLDISWPVLCRHCREQSFTSSFKQQSRVIHRGASACSLHIAPFLVQKKVPQNSYQHIGTSGKLLLFASLLSACRTLA